MTPSHSHFTPCGLPGIGRVPYGMHACHFYRDRDDLIAALVPYFIAGMNANERCLWIAAAPLPAAEALTALRAAWDGVDQAIESGALRIMDFDGWYKSAQGLKGSDVTRIWLDEEERALADGYKGLRITGNASFLHASEWMAFMEYEKAVSAAFSSRRIVALCSYGLDPSNEQQVSDVQHSHHCTLERPDHHNWVVAGGGLPRGLHEVA